MSTKIKVPEGWKSQNFGVKLKPGKPPGVTQWQDVDGRPVIKSGRVWALQKTKGESQVKNQKPKVEQIKDQKPQKPTFSVNLNEKQRETIESARESTTKRMERRLGKSPFDNELDTTTEKYKDNIDRMKPYMSLSGEQKSAINLYGQDGKQYYATLNKQLRTNNTEDLTAEDVEMNKFIQKNLTDALNTLPPKNGEVYRAVSGAGADQLANLKPGDIHEDKGFGSYSDNQRSIGMFIKRDRSNAVITVRSSTARNVSPIMEYDEGEHLSLPGTKYKLAEVTSSYSGKLERDIPHYIFEEVK